MSSFDIACIAGGPFMTNAYLVADAATRRCAVVDPGYRADEQWGQVVRDNGLELESILLTHGHIDHCTGVAALLRAYPGTPVLIHEKDAPMTTIGNVAAARMFGLPYEPFEATGFLEEGKPARVGETEFAVIHAPGHSPGSVLFHNGDTLISGDLIIMGSIGRTDLPGGDYPTLMRSIREKIFAFPDETKLYPGHGSASTVGRERRDNPYANGTYGP